MLIALKIKTGLAAIAVAAPLLAPTGASLDEATAGSVQAPGMVTLAPDVVLHRPAGDFSRDRRPITPPLRAVRIAEPLTIMQRQVTAAEYRRCVDAGACAALPASSWPDRPVVGVSWRDATAYAAWLSQATGDRYRLPTDEEWALAAGSRLRDEAVTEADASNPAARWLARYDAESSREKAVKEPQPVGTFGANEHGLLDVAGNVWEWTDSCFVRAAIETDGEIRPTLTNCGVRVVEGAHRTYVTDFIRDARAGGCAVGTPPANLGFRLVRDDDPWRPLRRLLARVRPLVS